MNFRKLITKNETLILLGRNDENNEDLIRQVKPEEEVFHTKSPGSPFVNIKGEPKKGDLKIAAILCAMYSQDWKKRKKSVIPIHRFKGKDIYKRKGMKIGTFGIKDFKMIKIKKEDILEFERKMVQADIQLGKQGITENFLGTLKTYFKNHDNVKVNVLKGAVRDKEKVKEFRDIILDYLGKNYTARIVGFSIFLKKWRKPVK